MSFHDHARWVRQAIVGLLMLPLSLVPFGLYFSRTDEGRLVWAKAETAVAPPRVRMPSRVELAWARAHAPDYTGRVALLAYHGLGSGSAESNGMTISPERFADQLVTLEAAGMQAVTARDVALATAGLAELPPNAYMISFDDGRTDAMLYADPILRELDLEATMFVITDAASDSGLYYVDWNALRGYARSGRWDIQSHTAAAHTEHDSIDGRQLPVLTSTGLDESPAAYAERVRDDLRRAARTIEREIGIPPLAFAYPFGAYGGEHDDRKTHSEVAEVVRDAVAAQYITAFHQDDQDSWGLASCTDDRFGQRRLEVGNWTGRELLNRISQASKAISPRESCTTARRTGHSQNVLESLPAPVRKNAQRIARLGDHYPVPRSEPDGLDLAPPLSLTVGDAISGCQAYRIACVGYPAPPPATPLFMPGPIGTMVDMVLASAASRSPGTVAAAGVRTGAIAPAAPPASVGTQPGPPPSSTGPGRGSGSTGSAPPPGSGSGSGSPSSPGRSGRSETSSPPSSSSGQGGHSGTSSPPSSSSKQSPSSSYSSPPQGGSPSGGSSSNDQPKAKQTSTGKGSKGGDAPSGHSSGGGSSSSPVQGKSAAAGPPAHAGTGGIGRGRGG